MYDIITDGLITHDGSPQMIRHFRNAVLKEDARGARITKDRRGSVNKIDIAEQVHASLEVMERDSKKMRGERPFVFTNLYDGVGLEEIIRFILDKGMLEERRPQVATA